MLCIYIILLVVHSSISGICFAQVLWPQQREIPNCDKKELVKWRKNMLKLKTESPFCDNFEDLGVSKSCPDGEKCYVGKCRYFKLKIGCIW